MSVPQVSLSTGLWGGDCKAPLIVLFPRISATPLIDFCHSGYRFAIFRPNSAPCHHFPGPQGPSSISTLVLIVDFIAMNLKLLNWVSFMWILWHTVWYAPYLLAAPFKLHKASDALHCAMSRTMQVQRPLKMETKSTPRMPLVECSRGWCWLKKVGVSPDQRALCWD